MLNWACIFYQCYISGSFTLPLWKTYQFYSILYILFKCRIWTSESTSNSIPLTLMGDLAEPSHLTSIDTRTCLQHHHWIFLPNTWGVEVLPWERQTNYHRWVGQQTKTIMNLIIFMTNSFMSYFITLGQPPSVRKVTVWEERIN